MTTTDLLDFGSDLALRYRYFTPESMAHPAKLHLGLLRWLCERYTAPGDTVVDPMAGIGSTAYLALLQRNVVLREIEPRWLSICHQNAARVLEEAGLFAGAIDIGQADAREPWRVRADRVVFSPPYGLETSGPTNSRRYYLPQKALRLSLMEHDKRWRQLFAGAHQGTLGALTFHYGAHPAQIGHLRGEQYWSEMTRVYTQARAALRPDGCMILVIKDHIRGGQRVCTADQTVALCESLGFRLAERHQRRVWPLSLWQRRRKEQGEPIVEEEDILVFQEGAP
jgi:predicted RNA methylase